MQYFRNAIPDLTESERRLFDCVYLKHPDLGNLPPILLSERMPFLKAPLAQSLEAVEYDLSGVILRLLTYYAEMADQRRSVDRKTQSYSVGKRNAEVKGHQFRQFEYDEQRPIDDSGNRRLGRLPYDDEDDDWERDNYQRDYGAY